MRGRRILYIVAMCTLALGGSISADDDRPTATSLFTPPIRRSSLGFQQCVILNVSSKPIPVTVELRRSLDGLVLATTQCELPPEGDAGCTVQNGDVSFAYCKFTVPKKRRDEVRAAGYALTSLGEVEAAIAAE